MRPKWDSQEGSMCQPGPSNVVPFRVRSVCWSGCLLQSPQRNYIGKVQCTSVEVLMGFRWDISKVVGGCW